MPAPIATTVAQTSHNGVAPSASSQVDEAKALERLLEVCSVVLKQGIDLVDNFLVSDDQLTMQSQYIPGSTIGVSFFLVLCIVTFLTNK